MPADLTGIENVGEFFSQHYVDELLLKDLDGLRSARARGPGRPPPDRLRPGRAARPQGRRRAGDHRGPHLHEALVPDEGGSVHGALDEGSHRHAHAVSTDLKFAARKAVELLGNEYVHYQRTTGKKALHGGRAAAELTAECLTYLYRLLFLFYAEARAGELGSLPMKAEEYLFGYSLEALRDLELVPLTTPEAQDGYFLHESLTRLFSLVDKGWENAVQRHTPRLSSVKLRNKVLQEVIRLLSLSGERRRGARRATRGRISYAQLGINQLGAVYEGLVPPFDRCDREEDMRRGYYLFAEKLGIDIPEPRVDEPVAARVSD